MKILHLPYCYHPDPVGGTEIYVEGLARGLRRRGVEAVVAAPAAQDAAYEHAGIPVRRFRIHSALPLRHLYGEGDPVAAAAFERVMDACEPDVVHLHAFTSAVSLRAVRAARKRGLPVVFTYHTPTVSCVRGTLLRWGQTICEGKLNARVCSGCSAHARGLGRTASTFLARVPRSGGRSIEALRLSGPVWTALRTTELVGLRHEATRALLAEVDRVVAVCDWVRALLVRNGVPREKVMLSRQGLAHEPCRPSGNGHARGETLRLVFAGRMDATKGVQVLLDAVLSRPELPLSLDIFAVAQGEAAYRLRHTLERKAAADSRVRFLPPVAADRMVALLAGYDVVAVPSQWLETGPLVVYEAFAAGVPVLGSDLGGIAELVRHGKDGLLVPASSVTDWADALAGLAGDPALVARLKSGISAPRTMDCVCGEMLALYRNLLGQAA